MPSGEETPTRSENGSPERNWRRSAPSSPDERRGRDRRLAGAPLAQAGAALGRVRLVGERPPVARDRLTRRPVERDTPVVEEHRALAEALDRRGVVGDEDDRAALLLEPEDPPEALPLERLVTDGEDLVEQEDVGVEERRDREAEPHGHPGRVRPHRTVDRVLELGEGDDLVEPLPDVGPAQPLDRAVQEDVLAPGEVEVEPRAELEERADPPFRTHRAGRRLDDPGDEPEQRRLPGAVPPDETDRLAASDGEGHVVERPHVGRSGPSSLDEEVLERVRLARMDAETPRDGLNADLARFHESRVEAHDEQRRGRGAAAFRDLRATRIRAVANPGLAHDAASRRARRPRGAARRALARVRGRGATRRRHGQRATPARERRVRAVALARYGGRPARLPLARPAREPDRLGRHPDAVPARSRARPGGRDRRPGARAAAAGQLPPRVRPRRGAPLLVRGGRLDAARDTGGGPPAHRRATPTGGAPRWP